MRNFLLILVLLLAASAPWTIQAGASLYRRTFVGRTEPLAPDANLTTAADARFHSEQRAFQGTTGAEFVDSKP